MSTITSTYYSTSGHFVSDETVPTLRSSLEFLGEGVSRATYALSDTEVLKVQCGYGGKWAGGNRTEFEAWENIAEEDRQHFAAVIAVADDYSWIVAERIAYTAAEATGEDLEILQEWRRETMYGLTSEYGIDDMHDGNYGIRADGRPAILDYAMSGNRDENEPSYWQRPCQDTYYKGYYCDECLSRHHNGATTEHGVECHGCGSRNHAPRLLVLARTGRKVGAARVDWNTEKRFCQWCRHNNRTNLGLVATVAPKAREVTGQMAFSALLL